METAEETQAEARAADGPSESTSTRRARAEHAPSAVVRVLERMELGFERGGDVVWSELKKRPGLGVAIVSLAGLGLATLIGASELVVALGAGVAAYQMLKKHEPPSKALEEASRFGL
jgi:hypothetical protein